MATSEQWWDCLTEVSAVGQIRTEFDGSFYKVAVEIIRLRKALAGPVTGAAPELLAALKMFVAAEEDWNKRDGMFDDPLTDAYHAARAAIAKAEPG